MTNRLLTASMISALSLATGFAAAADDALTMALADAESEALSLSLNNASSLKIGVGVQFRYQANFRDDASTTLANPDDDTTLGFVVRRAKVEMSGDITDNMSGKVSFAFNRNGGAAALEDAMVNWKINDDFTLRMGQFKLPILREENISWKRQLADERSVVNETFNQDRSQGIMAMFGGDNWRGYAAFTDGLNSDNTAFNAPIPGGGTYGPEADFAFTARAEMKFGDASFKQFDQFTSFRGAASGLMVGATIHWQTQGETNPSVSPEQDTTLFTADAQYVADGWNAFASFVWSNVDNSTSDFDDMGFVIQGGMFLSDDTELYARWASVMPDSDRAAGTGEDFSALSFGINHYLVPESHAAKLTLGVTWNFDSTTDSIVSVSDGHNLLADSEDDQLGIIAQAQFLF